jgi:hypothetical protein
MIDVWQKRWDSEPKGRNLFSLQRKVAGPRFNGQIRKEEMVLFAQLRLGHCTLNSSLDLFGKHGNGLCTEYMVDETVKHVLMYCCKYRYCCKYWYVEGRERLKCRVIEVG